ncbi:MAG TPA: holo-ACP synthase [Patescibacteria group bacterium]|nr:holo-ACP synthase [Patescibacteria group bacterium]
MILGIGSDIASIDRIARVLADHGDRFTQRCFAETERARIDQSSDDTARAAGYAKRWAAKEACAKALGLGIRDQIFLKDITVVNDNAGRPSLSLQGGAKQRLTDLTPQGMTPRIDVSLSDDGGMALAFVVISAGNAS